MKKLLLPLLFITINTDIQAHDSQTLVDHVKKSINLAYNGSSKLTQDVLNIDGMSSSKVRHLLNNICSLSNASYLEIGVWKGSTFISALYQNTDTLKTAVAIDNWEEFNGPKNTFIENTSHFLPNHSFAFYEQDCFTIDLKKVCPEPINIYFYDGNHTFNAQKSAFTYFDTVLANTFIAIVDDWSWEQVRSGTKSAFKELAYTVLFEAELPARYNGDKENWWNGFYIAVVQKNNTK